MRRTPFLTILALLLVGIAVAATLAFASAAAWWAVAGTLAAIAVVWTAWGADEWWGTAPAVPGVRRAPQPVRATPPTRAAATPRRDVPVAAAPVRTPAPPEPVAAASEYQPQCSALRADGVQCRNSARGGSKYCGSHVGYQPRTAVGVVRQTDTTSKVARRDTTTSFVGDAVAVTGRGAQCQALTASSLQCKNTVRPGSQFCVAHAGYRSPTPDSVVRGRDSKPRWAQAPDTLPSVRRPVP